MDTLEQLHPHARRITLDTDSHTYTLHIKGGDVVFPDVSVSKFAKDCFEEFDADQVVEKHFYGWKRNASSKYHQVIHSALSDEDAKLTIKADWTENGLAASRAGTAMHETLEKYMNGVATVESPELAMFRAWLRTEGRHYEALRTEWCVGLLSNTGEPLLAGSVDLVMRDTTNDSIVLVDYKRTNPKLDASRTPTNLLRPGMAFRGKQAKFPLQDVEDSDFGKYCTQLNIYKYILQSRAYGLVVSRMILLQLHPDLASFHSVDVPHIASVDRLFDGIDVEC